MTLEKSPSSEPIRFDALSWLGSNVVGGYQLRPEAVTAVSSLTLLWNLFEGLLCPQGANADEFERIAVVVARHYATLGLSNVMQPYIEFWRSRYNALGGFNDRFEGLNFRRPDRRELVESVLSGGVGELEDQVLAVLLVVYRLRNNLFHGIKTITMLNDQVTNLTMASQALAQIIEASGHYFVRHAAQSRPAREPNHSFKRTPGGAA